MSSAEEVTHLDVVNVHDAKTHLSRLLERVERGQEIVIARAGRPVARLVPIEQAVAHRPIGRDKGRVLMSEDFDDPLPWQAFPGFPYE